MSDLPMKQEDHPAHNMPEPTEAYKAKVLGDAMRTQTDPRLMGLGQRDEARSISTQFRGTGYGLED